MKKGCVQKHRSAKILQLFEPCEVCHELFCTEFVKRDLEQRIPAHGPDRKHHARAEGAVAEPFSWRETAALSVMAAGLGAAARTLCRPVLGAASASAFSSSGISAIKRDGRLYTVLPNSMRERTYVRCRLFLARVMAT